ncbi:unnamed protein product, partial [Dibothriocephalus latus]
MYDSTVRRREDLNKVRPKSDTFIFEKTFYENEIQKTRKMENGNCVAGRPFSGPYLITHPYSHGMPVPSGSYGQMSQPSCFSRMKMGFVMGFCVGVATGAIFGGFSCLRFGLRGRELVQTVGKSMIQGGGTFGMFMAIGTAI